MITENCFYIVVKLIFDLKFMMRLLLIFERKTFVQTTFAL